MKKQILSFVSIILVLFMFFSIAGCNASEKDKKESSASAESTAAPTASAGNEAPEEILYWAAHTVRIRDNVDSTKFIEDSLNVKMKFFRVDMSDPEAVKLSLATGDFPDLAWNAGKMLDDNYKLYNTDKLTRTIPVSMIREYMPEYAKLLDTFPPAWKMFAVPGNENELYALPGYHSGMSYFDAAPFLRLDWLKKLGIEVPGELVLVNSSATEEEKKFTAETYGDVGRSYTTFGAYTQDQLLEILHRFTKDDPDGNGKDDTYGMMAYVDNNYAAYKDILNMFGVQTAFFPVEKTKGQDESVFSCQSERYKEALKFIQNLYKSGYIMPESVTLKFIPDASERITLGMAGYFSSNAFSGSAWKDRAPYMTISKDPKAEFVMTLPTEGKLGYYGTEVSSPWGGSTYLVGKNVADEKLAKVLQFIEFCEFSEEAYLPLTFGKLGTQYIMKDGEPVNIVQQGGDNNEGAREGLGVYRNAFIWPAKVDIAMTPACYRPWKASVLLGDFLKKGGLYPHRKDISNTTTYNEDYAQYGTPLQTMIDEFFLKAITGKIDIDAEWPGYIKMLNDAGMSKLNEDLQKMPLFK